ncbi:helix-turn-helix domain-containing protein [Mycolicibacterium arenosum]|uniref:Helix-turn-helix transcriptional regulator n=1 Tax=Mycolicibacterium arenosum TaxID=2952157 RepID=A0ABT1LZH2_9MYCO|nr:helix-turn-helix domain-containing protein [Mycolicibacterium sp. CAU 1645]MCP9271577.1 helix-turn-helix transcriptional regulator [Mycolicibacterium sp. CAU 1645]
MNDEIAVRRGKIHEDRESRPETVLCDRCGDFFRNRAWSPHALCPRCAAVSPPAGIADAVPPSASRPRRPAESPREREGSTMSATTSPTAAPVATAPRRGQSTNTHARVGEHLRRWRARRGWSQLRVAVDCDVSTRHLSFVETGRARASRELIVHLARALGASNHELNMCLLAGGYAPRHVVELDAAKSVSASLVEMIGRHNPNPAFVFDADWTMQRLNQGGQWLCSVVMPDLWADVPDPDGGMDMLAALTHSGGLLSHVRDAADVGEAYLRQLRTEQLTNPSLRTRVDRFEASLRERFRVVPCDREPDRGDPSLHLRFDTCYGRLSFFTLQTVVGIPQQITVATPRVELWFPADAMTRALMDSRAAASTDQSWRGSEPAEAS